MNIEPIELDDLNFEESLDITRDLVSSVWNGHDITMNPKDQEALEFWLTIQQSIHKNSINKSLVLVASSEEKTESQIEKDEHRNERDFSTNNERSFTGELSIGASATSDGSKEVDIELEIGSRSGGFSGSIRGSLNQEQDGKPEAKVEGRASIQF